MPSASPANIRHLLSRTLFGFSSNDYEKAMGYGSLTSLVDQALLASVPIPPAPNAWVSLVPAQAQQDSGDAGRWYTELTQWWNKRMFTQGLSMQEKVVLFLHNHFSCERSKVNYPQYMYQQNQLFRKFAFGNFKQLVKEISTDATMLLYLDGNNSRGATPNENYGRELLELFTIGIGNYSENDVKQAAKALSGYQVRGLNVTYDPTRSYTNASLTILAKTAKFDANSLVDLIFEQSATAEFICRKIYQHFVYYKADEVFVKKMAEVFRSNNFELKPVFRFLMLSDEFYQPSVLASRIKNPQELMIGSLKALQIPVPDWNNVFELARTLQMQLFQPPDVAGWPGQREWISSTTYSHRGGFTDSLLTGKRFNGANVTGKLTPLVYARSFANCEKAVAFVNQLIDLFIVFPISDTKRAFLLETMLEGTIAANWSTNTPQADVRVTRLIKAMMRMPEFQLN